MTFHFTARAVAVAVAAALLLPSSIEAAADGSVLVLEDFSDPRHSWTQMNDPVMGGQSTGTFAVADGVGRFLGHVAVVPFLHAPGFIKAETGTGETWEDVSSCAGLQLLVRSETPYAGYRVSFGKNRPRDAMPYTYGYKADVVLDGGDGFQTVKIPFDHFTDKWDAATGDAVVTCAEDARYCPDGATKADLFSMAVWAEGVEGDVRLDLKSIAAYGCTAGVAGGVLRAPVAAAAAGHCSVGMRALLAAGGILGLAAVAYRRGVVGRRATYEKIHPVAVAVL